MNTLPVGEAEAQGRQRDLPMAMKPMRDSLSKVVK